jgi:hypothetical protein
VIKIFRKIRQKRLKESKFNQYMLYAIGEIVLVVIGILFALQINNWNENRKKEATLNAIYKIIQSDLETDSEAIDKLISLMMPSKPYYIKTMEGTLIREDFKKLDKMGGLMTGFLDITLQKRGINLLLANASFDENADNKLLRSVPLFYAKYKTEIGIDLKDILSVWNSSYLMWINTCAWYTDFSRGIYNDQYIEHALTSPIYRNQVTEFFFSFYVRYFHSLRAYQEESKEIIRLIKEQTKAK